MRVIINAIPLLTPRNGVGNYIYHTFKAMESMWGGDERAFYYAYRWDKRLRSLPSPIYDKSRKAVKRAVGPAYPLYRAALDVVFRANQLFGGFDLYHETNYIPLPFRGPTVVTVFDLSFLLHPETHPRERIVFMEKYFYPRLPRARHFITISESVKKEMVRHLNIPAEKITVTPLGVDAAFHPPSPEELSRVMKKYGLSPSAYVLSVGTLEPRKNISTLLEAYAALPAALRQKCPLVLSGGAGWLMGDLERLIAKLKIAGQVIRTGFIPDEDLPALYGGAGVFVFPSLYEGFGLPPLEAMACGAPVISSDVSSLPEVVGDGGVLVPPRDAVRLKDEIESFLSNPERREEFGRRGPARAKAFTWERCAVETKQVYGRCLA